MPKIQCVKLVCQTCKKEYLHPASEFVNATGTWPKKCPSCTEQDSHLLVDALKGLFENCTMAHKYWGDGDNSKEADAAIAQARAALALVEGK